MHYKCTYTYYMRLQANKVTIGIFLTIVVLLVVGVGLRFTTEGGHGKISIPSHFITSNPLDLSQIQSISQFRSCVGHDYSGINSDGEKETLRSMKHYITPKESIKKASVFAPFDGEISSIEGEQIDRGVQVWLSPPDSSWNFIFFHINLVDGLERGSDVKTGQLIGYSDLTTGGNFDVGLKNFGFGGQRFDSQFRYMTNEVLAEYAEFGITPENVITTKEYRDANPCPIVPGTESKYDTRFPSGDRDEDWVRLN